MSTLSYYLKRFRFCFRSHNTFNVSLYTRIKASLLGFTADEWVIFEFPNNNPKDYLSEYDRYLFRSKVRKYSIVFDNKLVFYRLMKDLAPVCQLYAYKSNGNYYTEKSGFDQKSIIQRIKENVIIVYKELSCGGGGKGFLLIDYRDNQFRINRKNATLEEVSLLFEKSDNYLLEQYCKQSDFENELFEQTVNTLRIITIDDSNDIQVAAVMQRIGANYEACADNASLGGLFCDVDLNTGELSSAFSYSKDLLFDESGNKNVFEFHPTTGKPLKGKRIPNFDYIKSEACRIHRSISFTGAKFVAWDFALTQEGYIVIEGNASSGMKFVQFHRGMKHSYLGNWITKFINLE